MSLPLIQERGGALSGLIQGTGQGLQQAMPSIQEMIINKQRSDLKKREIQTILGTGQQSTGGKGVPDNLAMQPPGTPELETSPLQKNTLNLTPEKVFALTQVDPKYGAMAANLYTEQEKERREQRKEAFAVETEERKIERAKGETLLEKRDTSRENLLLRKADYKIAKDAIERNPKDIGSLKNFISESFRLPQLKSASATAFSSAMKDAFVNTLKNIPGARLNQWVEQQVQSAMARIGQSDEANLSSLEISKFKLDLEEMENSLIDQLEEQAFEKGRKVTGQDKKEVYKRMLPYAEEKQFELGYKLKSLEEKEKGEKFIRKNILNAVPKGTPLTVETANVLKEEAGGDEEAALKAAIKLGYEIPSDDFLETLGYILND
jgi:hypothetical protein